MRYLHTMVRVCDLKKSLDFYCVKLGMRQVRRMENDKGRFTLVFLAAADDEETAKENRAPLLELWTKPERGRGKDRKGITKQCDIYIRWCGFAI